MCKYFKRESRFLLDNITIICLSAFLCAIGGVFLWVNGGSSWYLIRTSAGAPPLSVVFSVWVITYGLTGAAASMIWLVYRHGKCGFSHTIPWFCLALMSYLFMLVWYAVFFCTRLVVFAAIVLIISCIADILLLLFMRKTLIIFSVTMAIIVAVQLYFIWFTFAVA